MPGYCRRLAKICWILIRHLHQKKKVDSKGKLFFILLSQYNGNVGCFLLHHTSYSRDSICRRNVTPFLKGMEPAENPSLLGHLLGRGFTHRTSIGCYSWVMGFDVSYQPGMRTEKSMSTNTAWPPAFVQLLQVVPASPLVERSVIHPDGQSLRPWKFSWGLESYSSPPPTSMYRIPLKSSSHEM